MLHALGLQFWPVVASECYVVIVFAAVEERNCFRMASCFHRFVAARLCARVVLCLHGFAPTWLYVLIALRLGPRRLSAK